MPLDALTGGGMAGLCNQQYDREVQETGLIIFVAKILHCENSVYIVVYRVLS